MGIDFRGSCLPSPATPLATMLVKLLGLLLLCVLSSLNLLLLLLQLSVRARGWHPWACSKVSTRTTKHSK